MRRKLMSVVLAAAMAMSMAACGGNDAGETKNTDKTKTQADFGAETKTPDTTQAPEDKSEGKDGYELALVIDVGTIDDKSFNQGAWEGVMKYGNEAGVDYKYYKSAEATTDSYRETIELAIEGGAKTVVCPGYLFETPIYDVQEKYPDVKFILIDGEPHSEDYSDYKTADNTMAVLYEEDQAGFLAGYAAVKDGYENLGFMGGMALPAVIRYGYGYLAGADYAAGEMGKKVNVTYTYTGSFDATPEAQTMAASWFESGLDAIFACGGSVGNSVMSAAEASDGKVIGVDVDQSAESETIITSAMKMLSNSVYDAVSSVYDDTFAGGATTVFDINNDGVGIEMKNAKWNSFTEEDYNAIYGKMTAGEITIDNDTEKEVTDLELKNVTVNYVQ